MGIDARESARTELPVVNVLAQGSHGPPQNINVLLDTGSTASLLSVSAKHMLCPLILQNKVDLNIQYLGGGGEIATSKVMLTLFDNENRAFSVSAYVVPKLISPAAARHATPSPFTCTSNGDAASGDLHLLLGIDDVMRVVDRVVRDGSRYAFSTCWGFVECGSGADLAEGDDHVCQVAYLEQLNHALERFWTIDEYPGDRTCGVTEDEERAVKTIEENLILDRDRGRFTTRLLFRETPHLVNNYATAKARLMGVLRKLEKEPDLAQAYSQAMLEYLELGAVEEVHDVQAQQPERRDVYYLPHRAVYDPSKITSKCRIVFDASANTGSGRSLNSYLMAGPALQLEIVNLALRFRSRPVAAVGDISKMFLNIDMHPSHRDYLRFLWKEPSGQGEPKIYRFTTLIFGATDSPFQANTCLRKLVAAKSNKLDLSEAERRACQVILDDTYVDDITMGGETVEEVYATIEEIKRLLEPAHFFVKKWKTNAPDLLALIPESDRAPTKIEPAVNAIDWGDPFSTISEESKMLGLGWDPGEDVIRFRYAHLPALNENTKTSVASLLAKIYDPLGLASPFVMRARHILKCTHIKKLGWKDQLPVDLKTLWSEWVAQIPDLDRFVIPRFIPVTQQTELHVFADASNEGYGYAAYLRNSNATLGYYTHLLIGRSRVAPIKELTVPKLELVAAELAAKAATDVSRALNIDKGRVFGWTDSEVVLHWLSKDPHTLIPFMANRIRRIQMYAIPFSYVPTLLNPADLASRGCSADGLSAELWIKGPGFLAQDKERWPEQKASWEERKEDYLLGVKKQYIFNFHTLTMSVANQGGRDAVPLEDYHSTYTGLVSQMAQVIRASEKWKHTTRNKSLPWSERNWADLARVWWHREVQKDRFSDEREAVATGRSLPASSALYTLTPFLDHDAVLRVGGRLARADISNEMRHPVILDRHHKYVKLFVREVHEKHYHAGTDWVHHHLRQRFWIVGSRVVIKEIIKGCFSCERERAKPGNQIMGQLPRPRVNRYLPFQQVGVDYGGRLNYNTDDGIKEMMLLIFTCLSTRALHLELTDTGDTPDFLLAWKRMMGVRGQPQHVYSDNAKTFLRVRKLVDSAKSRQLEGLPEITWHFATERAPHTGGVWERMVQLVKKPMRKAIGNSLLTGPELWTLCKEIEGILNDRPLAAISADALEAITPSLLVAGRRLYGDAAEMWGSTQIEGHTVEQIWERRSANTTLFWEAWSHQYRQTLQRTSKWGTVRPNLEIGDLVLMKIDNTHQTRWPLARIIELFPDEAGRVRTVSILTKAVADPTETRTLRRSVHEIYPLECTRENGVGNRTPEADPAD